MADFTVIFKSLAPLATAGFGACDASTVAEWAAVQDRFPNRDVTALTAIRQLEHWCIDQSFHALGYSDLRITHTANGKPEAIGNPAIHLSIAHHSMVDGCWAAVALGEGAIGVDVEAERRQLQRIAPRFLSLAEQEVVGESLAALAGAWAVKECMFKAFGPALDFRRDLQVKWRGLEHAEEAGVIGSVRGSERHYRIVPMQMSLSEAPMWLALGPTSN